MIDFYFDPFFLQDLYVDRPLPYLIGSQLFMEQDDVGLGDLSSDGIFTQQIQMCIPCTKGCGSTKYIYFQQNMMLHVIWGVLLQ